MHCKGGNIIYINMLFDSHEVIYANGAGTESFHLGKVGIAVVDDASWAAVFAILPELRADLSRYGTNCAAVFASAPSTDGSDVILVY